MAARRVRILCGWAGCCILGVASLALGQTKQLTREFRARSAATFRVELRVRSEVEGQKPATIGAKTYLQPVSLWVEQKIIWQAERRIVSITEDGSAEIEESLDGFSNIEAASTENSETQKLLEALAAAVKRWETPRVLRYRESSGGKISGLPADAGPPLDELSPRVLTAWLLRGLRPTSNLSAHPLVFHQPWHEPRAVAFAEWAPASGSESGEWLEDADALRRQGEPTVMLQETQEISAPVVTGAEKPAEGSARAHFHAESLSTLALDDLRLMQATRSAAREIVYTLAPVDGLAAPPQFRGRLLVEIRIQHCDETPCTLTSDAAVRGRR